MNSTPIPVHFRVSGAKSPFFLAVPVIVGVLGLLGCDDTQPRTYTEVAFKPLAAPGMSGPMMGGADGGMGAPGGMGPMAGGGGMGAPGMNSSPVDIKVTWTLPETWMVKDSANAMRIGSFAAQDPALANTGEVDPKAVDVSVVQLAGNAGGLAANITRWNGQIGIKMTAEEMAEFVKAAKHFKTASGQDGMYVDLTDKLSGDMTQSKTIFGAVVQTEEYTVFVKAMGEQTKVAAQKSLVIAFCKSLKIAGPKS
jgi:hypothetical protein